MNDTIRDIIYDMNEQNITQRMLADTSGLHINTIGKILSGKHDVKFSSIEKIFEAIDKLTVNKED